MASEQYVIVPGTQQRIYEGSVVVLFRLPGVRWILHNGYYNYSGRKQKGWYLASIPSDTTMPLFNEDLVAMKVIDQPGPTPPVPPHPPVPPGPHPPIPPGPGPHPPVPIPIPFTPQDKAQVDASMITVDNMASRDMMGSASLQNGKIVRVNDIDGKGAVGYYEWDSSTESWKDASLGYRYMTREEIMETVSPDIVDIVWTNQNGSLVLTTNGGDLKDPVQLLGVIHDPEFNSDELVLRLPTYGQEDFTMTIPRDTYPKSIRFEDNWHFDDHDARAIVITVSDGITDRDIAGDVSELALTSDVIQLANRVSAIEDRESASEGRIEEIENRVGDIEGRIDFGSGFNGDILVSDSNGLARSGYEVGGSTLDAANPDNNKLATEEATIDAVSWTNF